MAKDPAILFYPNDWLGGTIGMSYEDKGAYMELLMMQFTRGHMTEHMIGQTIGQLWLNIKDKFTKDSEGKWYNERLDIEKEKRKNYVNSRKNNKKGNNQYTKKDEKQSGHMTNHMTSHMGNGNIYSNNIEIKYNISFGEFWNLYDKKVGDKAKAEKMWYKLKANERELIMEYVPKYKISQPEKKFRLHPTSFLNQRGWESELIGIEQKEEKKNYNYNHNPSMN